MEVRPGGERVPEDNGAVARVMVEFEGLEATIPTERVAVTVPFIKEVGMLGRPVAGTLRIAVETVTAAVVPGTASTVFVTMTSELVEVGDTVTGAMVGNVLILVVDAFGKPSHMNATARYSTNPKQYPS